MTIECENTLDDILAFNFYHFEHSPAARKRANIQRYGGAILLALVLLLTSSFLEFTPLAWLIGIGFIIAWILLEPRFHRSELRKMAGSFLREGTNKGVTGKRTFTLQAESVTETTDASESRTRWDCVEQIVKTDDYIFIYTSAVTAYVIPRRAFDTEAEYDTFFKTATKYKTEFAG